MEFLYLFFPKKPVRVSVPLYIYIYILSHTFLILSFLFSNRKWGFSDLVHTRLAWSFRYFFKRKKISAETLFTACLVLSTVFPAKLISKVEQSVLFPSEVWASFNICLRARFDRCWMFRFSFRCSLSRLGLQGTAVIPEKRYVESYFENGLLLNIHVSPALKLFRACNRTALPGRCTTHLHRRSLFSFCVTWHNTVVERKEDDTAYTAYVYVLTMNVLWTVPNKASFF